MQLKKGSEVGEEKVAIVRSERLRKADWIRCEARTSLRVRSAGATMSVDALKLPSLYKRNRLLPFSST